MQSASQVPIATQLHVDALIQREAYKVKRLSNDRSRLRQPEGARHRGITNAAPRRRALGSFFFNSISYKKSILR